MPITDRRTLLRAAAALPLTAAATKTAFAQSKDAAAAAPAAPAQPAPAKDVTRKLAHYIVTATYDELPANVRKGKRKHAVYHLEPEVVDLLKKIEKPKRDLVFPWRGCSETYYLAYGRILERAGLPNDKKHKPHCLRATHATMKEILGGDACRSLGSGWPLSRK